MYRFFISLVSFFATTNYNLEQNIVQKFTISSKTGFFIGGFTDDIL